MAWVKFLMIAMGLILVAQVAQARDISSFTDDKGVLHITNHGAKKQAGPENAPIPPPPQGPGTMPIKATVRLPVEAPVSRLQTPAANPGMPPIAPAFAASQPSLKPGARVGQAQAGEVTPAIYGTGRQDGPRIAPRVSTTSLQQISDSNAHPVRPVPRGKIVCYRDSHGVMHITNEPWDEENPAAPLAPAALKIQRPALSPAPVRPAIQEVSCPELGPEAAAYLKEKLQGVLTDGTSNTIQRYRDHQGIWRIINEPAPEPRVPPPLLASGGELAVQAVAHVPPGSGIPSATAWAVGFARRPLVSLDQTVVARRDPRGVLHIYTCAFGQGSETQDNPASFLGRVSPLVQACIIEAAQLYQLPVSLILALIRQESNFMNQAVSPKGAMGLMQLMPGTATSLGVRDPFDPRENVLAGCRYFRLLLDYFRGSVPLALAGYNAGHHRVVAAGCQIPNIKETQEFVTQVMGLYCYLEQRAIGL